MRSIANHQSSIPYRITACQFVLTLAFAGIMRWWVGEHAGVSALLGGMSAVVPGWYFAQRMDRCGQDPTPERVLRTFYLAEVHKIAMTAACFAFALLVMKADMLFLLLGYLVTVPVYWFALLFAAGTQKN